MKFQKNEQFYLGGAYLAMYRLGIKGNIPSYYLGGEISMMELELEKSLIVEK